MHAVQKLSIRTGKAGPHRGDLKITFSCVVSVLETARTLYATPVKFAVVGDEKFNETATILGRNEGEMPDLASITSWCLMKFYTDE